MGKQKTSKTAVKRIKKTNPKGNKKPKVLVNKSHKHHFQTKMSSRAKRRKLPNVTTNDTNAKNFDKLINK